LGTTTTTTINTSSDYNYNHYNGIIRRQELQTNAQYRSISQFLQQEQRERAKGEEGGGGEDEYNSNQKSNKRILLVDDEPDTCMVYQIVLEDAGYECKSYTDSVKSLEEFRPDYYDLILLDIKMPVLHGFELCKKIREVDKTVQIIFITASEEHYNKIKEQNYPELESIVSIQKPIGNEELLEIVNTIMATKDTN
jgi:two-component system catabolic regulation response regulator CreB/two-component system response regulator ChvI